MMSWTKLSIQIVLKAVLRSRGMVPVLLFASLILSSNPSFAQSVYTSSVQFDVIASPTVVDEGDVIYFELKNLKYKDAASSAEYKLAAHPDHIYWDFGEGTVEGEFGSLCLPRLAGVISAR